MKGTISVVMAAAAMSLTILGCTPPPPPPLGVLWYEQMGYRKDGTLDSDLTRAGATIIEQAPVFRRIVFRAEPSVLDSIRRINGVTAVMPWPEIIADGGDPVASVRARGTGMPLGAQQNGGGVKVSVFEIAHPYVLANAFVHLVLAQPISTGQSQANDGKKEHATAVAGLVAGKGMASGSIARGIAPGVDILAYRLNGEDGLPLVQCFPTTAMMDPEAPVTDIAQCSWGTRPPVDNPCDAFGLYNGFSKDFDQVVHMKEVTVVFSAGNHQCECYNALCGHDGYRMVMAPSTAKDIIVVGAVDFDGTVTGFSSFGPTADGRLVPHVVAPGKDVTCVVGEPAAANASENGAYRPMTGTSMSAPVVSGVCALIVQQYHASVALVAGQPARPSAALVKAVLLNNATDIAAPGPDYQTGYGLVDAAASCRAIDDTLYAEHDVTYLSPVSTTTINVSGNCPLKVLLCYSDPAASETTGAAPALINDLDLTLIGPDGTHLPLKLDPDNPTRLAVPGAIHNDNVEQVVVANPARGDWQIVVTGTSVTGSQRFAVTWTGACPSDPLPDGSAPDISHPR